MKRTKSPLNWVRSKLDWQTAGLLLSSPLVRTAALLPFIGYLIVFSSEMKGWLDFGALGEPFLFPAEMKLRYAYYGGAWVIVAYCMYALRCPQLLKDFKTAAELHEAPTRVGATDELDDIISRWMVPVWSGERLSNLNEGFPYVLIQYSQAVLEGDRQSYEKALSVFEGDGNKPPSYKGANHLRDKLDLSMFLEAHFIKVDQQKPEVIDEAVRAHQGLIIVNTMAKVTRLTGRSLEIAKAIYAIEYDRMSKLRPLSASFAVNFAFFGLLLIALPALETFLQVLTSDFSRLHLSGS